MDIYANYKEYNERQPRWPKGNPKGGQWKSSGFGSEASLAIAPQIMYIGARSPHVATAAAYAIQVIASTHRLPEAKIAFRSREDKMYLGQFKYQSGSVRNPSTPKILLNPNQHLAGITVTAIHEYGHFIDYLSSGRRFPSEFENQKNHPAFSKVVSKSREYKNWYRASGDGFVYFGRVKYKIAPSHFTYLMKPREVWARAYTQYVAMKSRDTHVWAEFSRQRKNKLNGYWSDKSFEPIAKEVEKVLESQGL